MSDSPFNEIIGGLGPLEAPSPSSVLRDAVDASPPHDMSATALFVGAAGDPMDAVRFALAETFAHTPPAMPELYLLPERRQADIPGDPAQAAAYLARLLTMVDPGQLATALRRLADALDGLAPMEEGPSNDD